MSQNELTATVKRIQELKRMQEEIAAELETLTVRGKSGDDGAQRFR